VLADQTLAGMVAAINREPAASTLDLGSAVRRAGWESVVLETEDWIVRFPRREEIPFATELRVLAHVAGRLPVSTPEIAWTGAHTRCMAYPKIVGAEFASRAWHRADPSSRRALTGSLAELLTAWRDAFTPEDLRRLELRPLGPAYLGQLTQALPSFPEPVRPRVARLLQEYSRLHDLELRHRGSTVLHGDFHLGNMVLTSPCGPVTGLWDFSCVSTGAPSWDLHYLTGAIGGPTDDPAPAGVGRHLELAEQVDGALGDGTGLVLAELMLCAEWIGDHDPAESTIWIPWLDQLSGPV
jgi:aminoglycoside phosphotransferase (APT) family kinase protein